MAGISLNPRLVSLRENTVTPETTTESSEKENLDSIAMSRQEQKMKLLGLLGSKSFITKSDIVDSVLADPVTKEALKVKTSGVLLGGTAPTSGVQVTLTSNDGTSYSGRTDTYYNLLEKQSTEEEETSSDNIVGSLSAFIPPPIRTILASTGILGDDYIPMRDLFTSPSVSFAYERGWRQGFASAGFPGPDKEYEMVREFFAPIQPRVVVDMSCATGLFTRRLAKSNEYLRVIGCDYSDSMLLEARRRIQSDSNLNGSVSTRTFLELVRCDVGNIPMKSEGVDALHAGAAMHCWPDLDSALSEIYRVLKPGGRFFATTFLAPYFRGVQSMSGEDVQQKAFQYFETVDVLKDIVLSGGFQEENIEIEVLGTACVVIKAVK